MPAFAPRRAVAATLLFAALASGCASGPHLDRDLWGAAVSDYLRHRGANKALVLDLDSFENYAVWNHPDAEEAALDNCRAAGNTRCTVAYRGNRSVLDVTPLYEPRPGKIDFAGIASVASATQAGLSGRPYVPPALAQSDAAQPDPSPQACLPNPPRCAAAGDGLKAYAADASARLRAAGVPDAAMAGMQAFCVNQLQAQVARTCADEYAAAGRQSCADLARRQEAQSLRVAQASRASAGSLATAPLNQACGW